MHPDKPDQDQIPGRLGLAPTVGSFGVLVLEGLRSCEGFAGTAVTVSQALVLYPHLFDFAPLAPFF